ncbi:sensor histidine kinase [Woodsholea maritima]|uniref:sensor histidine kinase n=1 Tax=Woodsholea maritima TaxID=240237 RepID=UPI0012EAF990|nr:PAS domain-containing sensor histidine kinase [Woodsholea maritima]
MTRLRHVAVWARRPSWFALGFVLSVFIMLTCTVLAGHPDSRVGEDSPILMNLLMINAAVILLLCIGAGVRGARSFLGRHRGEPAPQLHLRFIALFGIAALTPALVMAVFFGIVVSRGAELWYGDRLSALVESMANVMRTQVPLELDTAERQLRLMVVDMSQEGAVGALETSRIQYTNYLREQAIVRDFAAAYVVDQQSTVLARAESQDAPAYSSPSEALLNLAEAGDIAVSNPYQRQDGPDYVRILVKMPAYEDKYLYVVWYVDLSLIVAAEQATHAFRRATGEQRKTQRVFTFIYVEAAFLILAGAIWLALSAANRVVHPVGRLVAAAEQVRHGNLDVRVAVPDDNDDELTALTRAFNRMTRQLRTQRHALLEAKADADDRRGFIEAVLAGVSAGVISLDDDGRVIIMNPSARALLEIDEDSWMGQPFDGVIPVLTPIVEDARKRPGQEAERQMDLINSEGATVHLTARAIMEDKHGIIITFDDVTRLVTAQRNAAWRDVARRIAHEIKNPLTPIQLSAERLKRRYRKDVPEDGLETFDKCIDTIIRQVSDIGRMVDEFSSFARMPTPQIAPSDITEFVQGAVFAQRVASPDIHLTYQGPKSGVIVECDARLSAQALANILKNASESVTTRMDEVASKHEGMIAVTLYQRDDFCVVEVEDNGLGWPTPDKARLTEPYMTTREKGTGLGLAIVKRVMEDHGGHLELDDRPNGQGGAIVRLVFPLMISDTGKEDVSSSRSSLNTEVHT